LRFQRVELPKSEARGIADGYQFVIGLTPIFPSSFSRFLRFLL
jgi:hypothetical protein